MASSSSSSAPASGDQYPPMDNDYRWLHGRVDAGVDDNVNIIESLPVKATAIEELQQRNLINGSREGTPANIRALSPWPDAIATEANKPSDLLALPIELIDHVLSFLSPPDVVSVSYTCRRLATECKSDLVWQRHVQETVPGTRVTSSYPCKTFRELYIAHDPHWFLTKYKVWFCDYFLTGKIIIIRYDPRRGCIEGYQLIAEREAPTFVPWEIDDEVLIHSFNPECRLHKDLPILQLDVPKWEDRIPRPRRLAGTNKFNNDIRMRVDDSNISGIFSNFSLIRPVVPKGRMTLWPPSTIPARHRVMNANQESISGVSSRPDHRNEVSNQAFRIRKWMQMGPASISPDTRIGEEVYTYATLDPRLYTPTEEKPFRGIWVGDYSGHGCEFLLMNQPDNETPFDENSVIQGEDETEAEFQIRKREERIYRGSLEAIKLTGDPNVPRGEYTFISDDISKTGFVRTATEDRFKGARVVHSRGQIATRGFRNHKYIASQLIMVSHNRLAQYWVAFGHISYYERVDIEKFLDPANDPLMKIPDSKKR